MSTSSVKEASESADFFRQKIDWLFKHYAPFSAIAAIFVYALGYFFFNGYLSGFGYSTDSMPQDYVAVVLRAFFLFVYFGLYTMDHVFGIVVAMLIVAVVALVAIAILYAALKFGAWLLDLVAAAVIARWKKLIPSRISAAHKPPGRIGRALVGSAMCVVFVAVRTVVLWIVLAIVVISPIGLAQHYGRHLAEEVIDRFVECKDRPRGDPVRKRCVEIDAGEQGKFVGDVVAGSTDLLLIFDGQRAHLLKRSDELKVVALVKKPLP